MADTGVMVFILCAVMYPSHVATVDHEYLFYIEGNHPKQNVTVPVREEVTLVCINKWNDHRVNWYRKEDPNYVAYIDYDGGECTLTTNTGYARIKKSGHNCKEYNYGITLSSIQKSDGGNWFCKITTETTQFDSNVVNIQVTDQKTSLATPTTTTKPSTTSIELPSSTTTTVTPTTSHGTQGVNTKTPDTNVGVTENNVKATDKLIPLIAGAIGGTVGLMVIVTIAIVIVKKRKTSKNGVNRTDDNRAVDNGQNDDLDDDMGGEYAQISDTAGVKRTKQSTSASRPYSEEFVVADNPVYMQYNEEDEDKQLTEAPSSYETVPDVYSVVQKSVKPEASVGDVYSVVQKPPKSQSLNKDENQPNQPTTVDNDTGPDVYSVVQKPAKTQDQSSDKEVTDVYSVVQKTAKK